MTNVSTIKEDLKHLIDARLLDVNAVIQELESSAKDAGQVARGMVDRAIKELQDDRDALLDRVAALRERVEAAPEDLAAIRDEAEARWLEIERKQSELLWALRQEGDAVRRIVAARAAAQALAWSVRLELVREEYETQVAKAQTEIEDTLKTIQTDLEKVSQVGEISKEAFSKTIADIKKISQQALARIKRVIA